MTCSVEKYRKISIATTIIALAEILIVGAIIVVMIV